jgi:hypothetical protein
MNDDEKFLYNQIQYDIPELLKKNPSDCSIREKNAVAAYLRRKEHKYGCVGSFGVACGIKKLHRSSLCRKCYDSSLALKGRNQLLTDVFGFGPTDTSSSNVLNYKKAACANCGIISLMPGYPYCSKCLKIKCGLRVRQSIIPGAGVGLFTAKTFQRNEYLDLTYQGKILNKEEFTEMETLAQWDERTARRINYIFEVHTGCFIDGSYDGSGPLRFINQSPGSKFTNVQFIRITSERPPNNIKVITTKKIPDGCELFVDYVTGVPAKSYDFKSPDWLTSEGIAQNIEVLQHLKGIKK